MTCKLLHYTFILLTIILLSTELTQNQSNPLKTIPQQKNTHLLNTPLPLLQQDNYDEEERVYQQSKDPLNKPSTSDFLTYQYETKNHHHHQLNHQTNQVIENENEKKKNKNKKIDILKFFSTSNPLWYISTKIIKFSFKFVVNICFYPALFLLNLVNLIVLWVWDLFIFPMTFPIRLASTILIIKPIKMMKKIINKLKPILVFLISGITIGIFIGFLGSLTHLFLANLLFPIHISNDNNNKFQKEKKKGILQVFDHEPNYNTSSIQDRIRFKDQDSKLIPSNYNQDDSEDEKLGMMKMEREQDMKLDGGRSKYPKKEGRRKKKTKESDSDGSSLEAEDFLSSDPQEDEGDGDGNGWPLKEAEEEEEELQLGSRVSHSFDSNKLIGYSSAIQSIINDRTRKRASSSSSSSHKQHDNYNRREGVNHSPPSPQSILSNTRISPRATPPTKTTTSSHHHYHDLSHLSPSNKKKVTFKTD